MAPKASKTLVRLSSKIFILFFYLLLEYSPLLLYQGGDPPGAERGFLNLNREPKQYLPSIPFSKRREDKKKYFQKIFLGLE